MYISVPEKVSPKTTSPFWVFQWFWSRETDMCQGGQHKAWIDGKTWKYRIDATAFQLKLDKWGFILWNCGYPIVKICQRNPHRCWWHSNLCLASSLEWKTARPFGKSRCIPLIDGQIRGKDAKIIKFYQKLSIGIISISHYLLYFHWFDISR